MGNLTDTKIRKLKYNENSKNKYSDGDGLYLVITKKNKKVWKLDYRVNGKRTTCTIGVYPVISLYEARKEALRIKELEKKGINASEEKQKKLEQIKKEKNIKTFAFVVKKFLEKKKEEVSESRFKKNYEGTINNYILPFLENKPINKVTKQDILLIVKEVKNKKLKNDTKNSNKNYKAREVFNILKNILDFAYNNDYIEYPIAHGIDINQVIPKHIPQQRRAVIEEEKIKEIYKKICNYDKLIQRNVLKFIALTGVRLKNAIELKWQYIDFKKKIIIYPAEVMKVLKNKDFRLPITPEVEKILFEMKTLKEKNNPYVFISPINSNTHISEATLRKALKELGIDKIQNIHGFRTSLRTILEEHRRIHGISFEAIEAQLHHKIGNSVTQAYLRTDYLDERKILMEYWEKLLLQ